MTETESYQPDPEEIAADLADDGVHVDSSLADVFTDEQLGEITALVAGADPRVFVVAVPLEHGADVSANQLVTLVNRQLQEDGTFFVSRGSLDYGWSVTTTSYGGRPGPDDFLATSVAQDRYPSDLGLQMREAVEIFTGGDAETIYDEHFPERAETGSVQSTDGEPAQILGMDPAVAIGVATGIAAMVVLAVLSRRRARRKGVRLKRRALQRISSAQTQEWRRRAEAECTALGERIRELEIEESSDNDAWGAALNHYQAATAVLDRSDDAADSIGAMVLARRGDEALDHAVAGNPWKPTVVCFFNPLHGPADARAPWTTTAGTREVPCCRSCRRHIGRRREPEILDLPTEDTVVHYMDSGAEPWASTGFGALTPDLLDQLRQH
ncbi:hypothetical protein [Phytoactinopolyspora mesophila]|uniref:Uncharacterized protein n=1 Tax=Phytoactinopolyspora mesophila TaxID=2650750 RepID=A0A7K3M0G2_9ACTN|nr:hypothetical protein [Phytoactinopolyspora mesophila]NDL56517.1 hypothetical protein [Phytoactinopolyspora mesophila]